MTEDKKEELEATPVTVDIAISPDGDFTLISFTEEGEKKYELILKHNQVLDLLTIIAEAVTRAIMIKRTEPIITTEAQRKNYRLN
jgi:hypothetical protein